MQTLSYNPGLESAIATIVNPIAATGVEVGVAVIDPNGAIIAGIQPDRPFEALSVSKLIPGYAGGLALQSGVLSPDTSLLVLPSDLTAAPGGFLHLLVDSGRTVTIAETMAAMLGYSDTTAQRMIVRTLGGPNTANAIAKAHPPYKIQQKYSGLRPVEGAGKDADARFYTGYITAAEAARLLGRTVMDDENAARLGQGIFDYGLRRDLPDDVRLDPALHALLAQVRETGHITDGEIGRLLSPDRPISPNPNIMGIDAEEGSRHDVAKIGPVVVAVMTEGYDPRLPEDPSHPAHNMQAQIGRTVYDYVNA